MEITAPLAAPEPAAQPSPVSETVPINEVKPAGQEVASIGNEVAASVNQPPLTTEDSAPPPITGQFPSTVDGDQQLILA